MAADSGVGDVCIQSEWTRLITSVFVVATSINIKRLTVVWTEEK